ncbi:LOW QUALITY PROTEIN: mucin-16-like [Trichechus inunguis]
MEFRRPKKDGEATRGDAICTLRPDPEGPRLNREWLYWELNQLTHGVTQLGPYTLDRDSLYVNAAEPTLVPFTLNFTITNLCYTDDMGLPGSTKFNFTERVLQCLLGPLLNKTSIGALYSGFIYGASASTTTTEEVREDLFTLNFTIDNLHYLAYMAPGSVKFNITDTLMQHLLSPLFQRSSLGALYAGCRLTALKSEKNSAWTGVNTLCTYWQPPRGPGLHAKQVFLELSWQTRGITRPGPYSLDKDSLYLNATGHTLKTFLLNFTISNLQYSPDMSNLSSATFNSTERVLQHLLRPLFQNSSLGPFYSDYRLISLRPEKHRAATRVDTICTCNYDPTGHSLDRERLYWELSQLTQGVTRLGHYTLDRGSLSVNGVEPSVYLLTDKPMSSPSSQHFQLNFTITNLLYSQHIAQPNYQIPAEQEKYRGCAQPALLKQQHQEFFFRLSSYSIQVTTCLPKKEGDYEVQRHHLGYYLPHLDLRKLQ